MSNILRYRASFLFILFIAFAVYLFLEQESTETKVEVIQRQLACEKLEPDDLCTQQATRLIRACVLDEECRKLFTGLTVKQQEELIDRVEEQIEDVVEGGGANSGGGNPAPSNPG